MKTKFLIFSQSRSGSTLLKELINSHPSITCEGEIFTTTDGYLDSSFFCKVWRKLPYPFVYYRRFLASSGVFGFTLFIYHIPSIGRIMRNLCRLGWKIIYLERENIIHQSLSNIIAMETNNWHRKEGQPIVDNKFQIPVNRFLKVVKNRIRWHKKETEILRSIPHLKITYEADLMHQYNWQESLNKIFNYLGKDVHPVQSNLKRTYSKAYSNIVDNYDELMDALKDEELSYLLDVIEKRPES